MVSERKRAQDKGYPSPIHDTIEDTHTCYEGALEVVLDAIAKGERVEVLVASHNQVSSKIAVKAVVRSSHIGLASVSDKNNNG